MGKQHRQNVAKRQSAPPVVALAPEPIAPPEPPKSVDVQVAAKSWLRVLPISQKGHRAYVLERLEFIDGQPVITQLEAPNMRTIALARMNIEASR